MDANFGGGGPYQVLTRGCFLLHQKILEMNENCIQVLFLNMYVYIYICLYMPIYLLYNIHADSIKFIYFALHLYIYIYIYINIYVIFTYVVVSCQ